MKSNYRPLILITNDDGIHAKGIHALVDVAKLFGDVIVVAPDKGNSAKSHCVTLLDPIFIYNYPENDNVIFYACSGTPVDSVKIALHKLMPRKPDIILSGINHGNNASVNVWYSGTMAAAIEGAINGISSIGFSILSWDTDANFDTAKHYCKMILENTFKHGLPEKTALNINIPYVDINQIKGIKVCRQTQGTWKDEFIACTDPRNRNYYWMTGDFHNTEPNDQSTDQWALNNNFISIVPIDIDLTSYKAIDWLNNHNYNI